MRALVSSWRRTCPQVGEGEVQALLSGLALTAPSFSLPPSTQAHVRHYVPFAGEQRLLLDAFVVVGRVHTLGIVWPELELTGEEEALLDRVLPGVSYLGRSQSWCEVRRAGSHGRLNAIPGEQGWTPARVLSPLPGVRVEQLCVTTQTLRNQGHNRPPGSRWVSYAMEVPEVEARAPVEGLPTVAVYLMSAVGKGLTLPLADLVRRQLNTLLPGSPTFLGKGRGGPRQDGHRHLHILPDGEGESLTRLVLWAPEGFGEEEATALRALRVLPALKGQGAVRLVPDVMGEDELSPLREVSKVWRSWTPYLPARHGKKDGREGAREQILGECERRGLPRVRVAEVESDGLSYQVHRGPRPGPGAAPAWFRLEFAEPVVGPLCLGAQAHFGMGRFVAGFGRR